MKIDTLKDLQKLMALCRKEGIESITIDNVTFKMGDRPEPIRKRLISETSFMPTTGQTVSPGGISENTKVDDKASWDSLSDEQKMFYSSAGIIADLEAQRKAAGA